MLIQIQVFRNFSKKKKWINKGFNLENKSAKSQHLFALFILSFHALEQLTRRNLTTLKRTASRQCCQRLMWCADLDHSQKPHFPQFWDWLVFKQMLSYSHGFLISNQCCSFFDSSFIKKHVKSLNTVLIFFYFLPSAILISSLQEHLPALKPSVLVRGGLQEVLQSSS